MEDHWNQGDAQKAIAQGKWDVVVLQQGPSALPESRVSLLDYTRRFAEVIRAEKMALYAEDQFHPSVIGSYLAALVIYEKLLGKSPLGLPAALKLRSKALTKIELSQEQTNVLQAAAVEANNKF